MKLLEGNSNGYCFNLRDLPLGSSVYGVFSRSSNKSCYIQAAGCYGRILYKTDKIVYIRLPSGQVKVFSVMQKAFLGQVLAPTIKKLIKAGESRWRNRRPSVRGVAINPVDHPHGGGEGKGYTGKPPVSPWGKRIKK